MKYIDEKEIREKLNKISFIGLEDNSVGDALYFEIKYNTGTNPIREIKKMIEYLSKVKIEWNAKGEQGRYFFFAEKDNARVDHIEWFKKVYNLLDDAKMLIFWNESDGRIHWKNYKYLYMFFCWLWQVRNIRGLKFRTKFHYVCWLTARYPYYKLLKEHIDKLDNLICFVTDCDVHCCSLLGTEEMNKKGVKTVTIAHGYIMDENSEFYYNGQSDYMVLYSDLMLQFAKKFNNTKKYIVLGDPRGINKKFKNSYAIVRNKKIGVLLSYGIESDENKLILESAISYAKKKGYKLKIKKHPIERNKELIVNKELIAEIVSEPGSIQKFVQDCDVVIAGTSNTFFESVMELRPTFLADSGNPIFEPIEWCKFSNAEGLQKLMETYIEKDSNINEKMLELRNQVAVTDDVARKYTDFFNSLVGDAIRYS